MTEAKTLEGKNEKKLLIFFNLLVLFITIFLKWEDNFETTLIVSLSLLFLIVLHVSYFLLWFLLLLLEY